MSEFWEFIKAVFSHWQAYVTGGGITAILQVWERLTGKSLSKRTYAILVMVGFLLVAFFLAWRDQHQALQSIMKEKSEISRQLSEMKQIPRPTLEDIRPIYEFIASSPYQDAPYGMKIVVQTNVAIQPLILIAKCNVSLKYEETALTIPSGSGISAVLDRISPNDSRVYEYKLELPAFMPGKPLVIKLWSDQPITACPVYRLGATGR